MAAERTAGLVAPNAFLMKSMKGLTLMLGGREGGREGVSERMSA